MFTPVEASADSNGLAAGLDGFEGDRGDLLGVFDQEVLYGLIVVVRRVKAINNRFIEPANVLGEGGLEGAVELFTPAVLAHKVGKHVFWDKKIQ